MDGDAPQVQARTPEGPFAASPDVSVLTLGARTALFSERTQQLSEFNTTATLIWSFVRDGMTRSAMCAALTDLGASAEEAANFVDTVMHDWLRAGHLTTIDAAGQLSAAPAKRLPLTIGPLHAEVQIYGQADDRAIAGVVGHLAGDAHTPADVRVAVVGRDERDFCFIDGAPAGTCTAHETPAWIKAQLTRQYCESVSEGFLAHGGLVSANGKRIFISGPPGAGKSTLVLALAHSGFAFSSDDIVHIGPDGAAVGAGFAAAAKVGAWPLLRSYVPNIDALPVFERPDAQSVRYVVPASRDGDGAKPIDIVVLIEREPGAPATLTPVDPLDALVVLLDSGYAKASAAETRTVGALGRSLARGACFRLTYDKLADAIAAIKTCVHA